MKYNNIEFEAIVATPGCGKSYLCDKYPHLFVDVDEVRLKCKYFVPENITREQLEATKGERTFKRRSHGEALISDIYSKLDTYLKQGKTLIAAPHPDAIDYLIKNNIKFCFVYPSREAKEELVRRMTLRGNPPQTIKENDDMFEQFYESNCNENRSVVKYEFNKDEYLEDIIKKFGFDFNKNNTITF